MPLYKFSKRFLKDLKKWKRSGKDLAIFEEFVRSVERTWPPPSKFEAHLLLGDHEGIWDVHLRQNWLILVRFHEGTVHFLRMGTHADLGL